MFEFECWHVEYGEKWCPRRYIAETAGKAKSKHYRYLQNGIWEDDFFTVVQDMKCRKVGETSIHRFFGDKAQFERVKQYRNIQFADQEMRVKACEKMGTIVGANDSGNLNIVFDGEYQVSNCHPHWEIVYFDEAGNIIAEYGKGLST